MELIKEWWAVGTGLLALCVWMVRLEGGTKLAMREISRLERQMESDRKAAQSARQETNDMLREMRGDIKRLLERNCS